MASGDSTVGIQADRVTEWFRANIEGAEPPFSFEIIKGGHSNLTFRVGDAAGNAFVLRRPPLGAVIATAHDMAREHKIVSAVAATPVPVPPVLGLCEDTRVNDAPFYVMKFVEGVVLDDADRARAHYDEAARYSLGIDFVNVLVALHQADPDAIGLGDLGRKENYLARQLERWRTQWGKTKTRELPAMEMIYETLSADIPEQVGATVVHGDYRLGNVISNPQARVAAVLDWELCTLGDPLASGRCPTKRAPPRGAPRSLQPPPAGSQLAKKSRSDTQSSRVATHRESPTTAPSNTGDSRRS